MHYVGIAVALGLLVAVVWFMFRGGGNDDGFDPPGGSGVSEGD